MQKYHEYSFTEIKRLIKVGQKASANGYTEENFIRSTDYSLAAYEKICLGFRYPNYNFDAVQVLDYLRIGEPDINSGGTYKNSYNYAEGRREDGVSVVTINWLHSLKSVFFNSSDEAIARRGVWKIKGFALPARGGDDELLVIPLDWAERTKIRTRAGLERAVKQLGY